MFERFTTSAREVVHGALRHADDTGSLKAGEAELLLALLDRTDSPAAHVLAALGADARHDSIRRALADIRRRGGLSASDAEALAGLGIDVDEVVARVEEAHGVGALAAGGTAGGASGGASGGTSGGTPARGSRRARRSSWRPFAPEAKSVLERSLRIAIGRGDKRIGDEHLLLALTARPGPAASVLADHQVTYVQVEQALAARPKSGPGPGS